MRTTFLLSGLALFVGCGEKTDDTGSSDDAFSPTAGQWSWQGTEYTTDSCNMAESFPVETIDAAQWDLVLSDDGFTLDNELWTDPPIECVVSGSDFTCSIVTVNTPEAWPEGSEQEAAPDATYTNNATVDGVFLNAETATIAMTGDLSCEGADCAAHGEASGRVAPCSSSINGEFLRSE